MMNTAFRALAEDSRESTQKPCRTGRALALPAGILAAARGVRAARSAERTRSRKYLNDEHSFSCARGDSRESTQKPCRTGRALVLPAGIEPTTAP